MILTRLRKFSEKLAQPRQIHTTIHLTHAKAGSTWLDRIFRQLLGPLVAPRGYTAAREVGFDTSKYVFPPGRFYSAMFLSYEEFLAHPELEHARRFVVLRDPRDTVVSNYFSLKVSHPPDEKGQVAPLRSALEGMNEEEGMLFCMSKMRPLGPRQLAWWRSGELIYKYEDLIRDDITLLSDLILDQLKLPLSSKRVRKVILENQFEARFKRPLGTVDVNSHGRVGAPGNWRKHFTPPVAAEFIEHFGDALLAGGYEKDHGWVSTLKS